jgi:RluA family pseudouridine synthase
MARQIIFQDTNSIVVNKPAGIPSVGPRSAEAAIRDKFPEIQPVHRLDNDTSGCLIFARSDYVRASLEQQFRERRIEKIYHAIVIGQFPDGCTRVDKPVQGLDARTDFLLLRRANIASYIEAHPRTGRTHQIRAHLKAIGFPIAGDRVYATREVADELLRSLPRHMLHAIRISWHDPTTGSIKTACAPLPSDFLEALKKLQLATHSPHRHKQAYA